tara:strand:+ start:1359 stop:1691 length:333 start_codon:yes stop_codon:yes gene_type:complete
MQKWIEFQDSATDCHWVPVKYITAMHIADANDVIVHFRNYTSSRSGFDDTNTKTDSIITITDTARALTLGKELADYMAGTKPGGPSTLVIKANGDGISKTVSTVAFTTGS